MKGVVNIEFVLSILIFLTTITFATVLVINNIPTVHEETIVNHLKTRAYQVSEVLLFSEGFPNSWNENNVARIGLSAGEPYNLSVSKIHEMNDTCANNMDKFNELLGELGVYIEVNITIMDNNNLLTPACSSTEAGFRFTITRFAVIEEGNLTKMDLTIIAK